MRKRPQSETVRPFQGLGMKITTGLLFEIDSEELVVEFATRGRVADDGTKASNEQNLDSFELFHSVSRTRNKSRLRIASPPAIA